MKKFHLSLQWKFFFCIVGIILPILSIIFIWAAIQNERQATRQVLNQARILARQVILTRQWVTDCGGIMVPQESQGAKGMAYFFDDRLDTSRGTFQRFTPSMVTKQLSLYSTRQDLYHFRLASLTPINPQNSPDAFEKEALIKFNEQGIKEMIRFGGLGRQKHLQYMVPLYVKKGCLKCHHEYGSSPDGVSGGLSIFLPIDEMKSSIETSRLKLAVSGAGLVLLTVFTLFVLMHRLVIRPLKDFEKMTSEIGKGNLDARVNIRTGDEFQPLGDAFNDMATRISRGRELLEERIAQATRELSEANRELQTLDKLKSDFLANMSHELRSPLTVIRGGIDYLNRTIKIEDNRNYLEIIDKNLARLISMVSDLFDFTKIEAQTIEWSFASGNLAQLIEETVEIMSPLATDKAITIRYENPGDIAAELDLERIEQVLVNLIDNAVKFSEPGTVIDIKVQDDQETVTVSVKDQGPGIANENLKTIFDKFSTAPSGSRGKHEGTGLGLAICKAIVEAHEGHIWVESTEGLSSTFYFTLPRKRA